MAEHQFILLTGATGNLGAVILDQILTTTSHSINAILRKEHYVPLFKAKYESFISSGRLAFTFIPDMSLPGVFDSPAELADAIIHVATPLGTGDWVNTMIEPTWAIDKNVLEAAQKSRTVKRVIICGTMLQALDIDQLRNPKAVLNEEGWCSATFEVAKEGPFMNAYPYSKTIAERKTWAWMDENKQSVGFDVVMLLPPGITGRSPQVGYTPNEYGPGGIGRIYYALFVGRKAEDLDFMFPFYM